MRIIEVIETADGVRHESYRVAAQYLENQYAETLHKCAHALIRIAQEGKPLAKVTTWIDANLSTFTQLQAIKSDMSMTAPDSEG